MQGKAGPEQPIKCDLSHMIHQIYKVVSSNQYLDTDKVLSFSYEKNLKLHLHCKSGLRCIDLQLMTCWHERKSYYRKITYINLIFRKTNHYFRLKTSAKIESMKTVKNSKIHVFRTRATRALNSTFRCLR